MTGTRALPGRAWLLPTALAALAAGTATATAAEQGSQGATGYTLVSSWGKTGTADGQFKAATGIGIDPQGNVYVADGANNRVQKFDAAGAFVTAWGSIGPAPGQFRVPADVAIDATGNVWVSDYGNNRLQRFTTTGGIPTDGKTTVIDTGKDGQPDTIAVDAAGNLFETEFLANHARRYDAASNWSLGAAWGTPGKGAGQFAEPRGIAASPDGSVYVADRDNYRVQRFDANGKLLNAWGSNGLGPGQFREPRGAAVDLDCNVWIADSTAHRLQKFTPAGGLLGQIPNTETSLDVAVGPSGDIYVLETTGVDQRIQRYRETPGPKPANTPAVLNLTFDAKTKSFLVNVPYTPANISCPTMLAATASLQTAGGKVLGTRAGLQLPANRSSTIAFAIAKAAIARGGFKTGGSFLTVPTRFSIVLKTNGRDTLATGNGTLRISIAAIKSGALPGLTALLGR